MMTEADAMRQLMRDSAEKRRAEALAGRWFWMPCPLCGEYFGGQEWRGRIMLPDEGMMARGICLPCELEVGAQAAAICERDGHSLVESLRGDAEYSADGSAFRLKVAFDLGTVKPEDRWCRVCGADL